MSSNVVKKYAKKIADEMAKNKQTPYEIYDDSFWIENEVEILRFISYYLGSHVVCHNRLVFVVNEFFRL